MDDQPLRGELRLGPGECATYVDGEFYSGSEASYETAYAMGDQMVVGNDAGVLQAGGGPCRVVALYRHELKLGAVVHVDAMHLNEMLHHREMIARLFAAVPELLSPETDAFVCGDVEMQQGDFSLAETADMRERRLVWNADIVACLQEQQIARLTEVIVGYGKDVRLDTSRGTIKVIDSTRQIIFARRMGKVKRA